MMIATADLVKRPIGSIRSQELFVLDPPRHLGLPLAFLGQGSHLIGSSDSCSIRLSSEGVQPHHAMITIVDKTASIKALDLMTWVNDGTVSESSLRLGDRICVGPITFKLRLATEDEHRKFEELNSAVTVETPPEATQPVEDELPTADLLKHRMWSADLELHPEASELSDEKSLDTFVPEQEVELQSPLHPQLPMMSTNIFDVSDSMTALDMISVSADESKLIDQTTDEIPEFTIDSSTNDPDVDPPIDEFDLKAREIELEIEDLNGYADQQVALPGLSVNFEEQQRLADRELEHKQLADELAYQLRLVQERNARADEREIELHRKQEELAAEHTRITTMAEATRCELSEAYARQKGLWQDWDAAHRRTSDELNGQVIAIEQRRAAIQSECEQFANERTEMQRLREDHERARRAVVEDRHQLDAEIASFQQMRAAFEAERHQRLVTFQEREASFESERRELAEAQTELLELRQKIERDRIQFATERSEDAHRREKEIQEHSIHRTRLDAEQTSILTTRNELDAERQSFDRLKAEFDRERAAFETARIDVNDLRSKLSRAEAELALLHQSTQQEIADRKSAEDDARRRSLDLDELQKKLEQQQYTLEATRSSIQIEQRELEASREEMSRASAALQAEKTALAGKTRSDNEVAPRFVATIDQLLGVMETDLLPSRINTKAASSLESSMDRIPSYDNHSAVPERTNVSIETSVPSKGLMPDERPHGAADMDLSMSARSGVDVNRILSDFGSATSNDLSTHESRFDANPYGEVLPDLSSLSQESLAPVPPPVPAACLERETMTESGGYTAVFEASSPEQALTDINERFGYVAPPKMDVTSFDGALDKITNSDRFEVKSDLDSNAFSHIDKNGLSTLSGSAEPASKGNDSLATLRAQLAKMFEFQEDLPADASSNDELSDYQSCPTDDGESSSIAALADDESEEFPACNLESFESTEHGLAAHDSVEHDVPAEASNLPHESQAESSPAIETAQAASNDEDAWARRLRELSEVAKAAEPPKVSPSLASETKVSSPQTTDAAAEDEFSVEAQLARLLGRPLVRNEISRNESAPAPSERKVAERSDQVSSGSSDSEMAVPIADRSHLVAEPTHKQNKNAVREEVQSFRAVAQMSARSALAKHSSKTMKSAVYFTAGLSTASAAAAAWFVSEYLVGREPNIWNGVACTFAAIISASRLVSSTSQIKKSRKITAKNDASDRSPSK